MKYIIPLLILFFVGCQKYEAEILLTQEQFDILNEQTDGVVVYLFSNQVYSISDLGKNNKSIPNTQGAHTDISLNYTKDKVAYFNADDLIEIINIDGSNKEVLSQYNARHFEWSKKEDALFILENGSSSIITYGTATNFNSPQFAANVSVDKFCVSNNYLVAYSANVTNPPYSDLIYVKEGNNTVYLEVFNSDQRKFNSLEFTAEEKLFGSYNIDYYYLYSYYFNPATQFLNGNSKYLGFDEIWTLDLFKTENSYMKNVRDYEDNFQGYNIYRFREDGSDKRLTRTVNSDNPIVFDWKK